MDVLRIPAAVTSRLPGRLGESVGPPVVSVVPLSTTVALRRLLATAQSSIWVTTTRLRPSTR